MIPESRGFNSKFINSVKPLVRKGGDSLRVFQISHSPTRERALNWLGIVPVKLFPATLKPHTTKSERDYKQKIRVEAEIACKNAYALTEVGQEAKLRRDSPCKRVVTEIKERNLSKSPVF